MSRHNRTFTLLLLIVMNIGACQPLIQSPTHTAHSNVQMIGHIGGAAGAIAVQGDYAYLGFSHEWMVLDIHDPSQPRWVAALNVPANDTDLTDQMAYVVGRAGLAIIDIANPRQPQIMSLLPSSGTLTQVNVVGHYAYFTGIMDLYVADVTDPASPTILGEIHVGPNLQNLVVVGNYAYLTSHAGLHLVDLSDPAQPVVSASLALLGVTRGLAVRDGYAYYASNDENGERLHVVDIRNPERPLIVAQVNLVGRVDALHLADDTLYLANREGGVDVWQLAAETPGMVTQVGAVGAVAEHGLTAGLTVQNGYLYLVDFDEGLRIFDASDPAQVVEVGRFTPLGLTTSCAVSADTAYVVAGWDCSLHGIQVADGPHAHEIDWHIFAGTVCDFVIASDYAYLLDCTTGLRVIDIATATQPQQVGFFHAPGFGRLTVAGTHLYLGDGAGAIQVVDVRDPTQPREVEFYPDLGYAHIMATADGVAYIPYHGLGMRILTIGKSGELAQIGLYPLLETVQRIAVAGRYAYLALGAGGVQVVDVGDPTAPQLSSRIAVPGEAVDLVVDGDYLLIAAGEAGLRIVDVRDPRYPAEAGFYDTPGFARSVTLVDGVIYVADNLAGLYMLTFAPLQGE